MTYDVHIIGGGLAGCEAAWQLGRRGAKVRLSEMRGSGDTTPAHQTDGLAELVCSNSFRSDDDEKNAVGLLHHEMRQMNSLIMQAGEIARVPAGSAMAVDRDVFSAEIEQALKPFKQLNALKRGRGDGTGLGLPLTKAMVEANRARFSINSTPGEGTLVEVSFPSTRVLAG